jgi:hypothetical protein
MGLRYSTDLGAPDRVKNDLAFKVRKRIFARLMEECAPSPSARVADFGVSGNRDHPAHYFFESLYPYRDRLLRVGLPFLRSNLVCVSREVEESATPRRREISSVAGEAG